MGVNLPRRFTVDTTLKAATSIVPTPSASVAESGTLLSSDNVALTPDFVAAFVASFGAVPPAKLTLDGSDAPAEMTYKLMGLVPVGDSFVLLASGEIPDASHVDNGALAIVYLQRPTGGSFEKSGIGPSLASGTGFGRPPEVRIRTDLLQYPVLMVTAGWSGQGCSVEQTQIIELAPTGPVQIATVPKSYANGDSGFESTIDAVEGRTEFRITYKGDAVNGGRTVAFKLVDGKFVPTAKVDDLPGC